MLRGLLRLKPKKKEEKIFKRLAVIAFKDTGDLPVDDPLMKEILFYEGKKLVEIREYSDVIIDRLKLRRIPVKDETADIVKFVLPDFVKRDMGTVEFIE